MTARSKMQGWGKFATRVVRVRGFERDGGDRTLSWSAITEAETVPPETPGCGACGGASYLRHIPSCPHAAEEGQGEITVPNANVSSQAPLVSKAHTPDHTPDLAFKGSAAELAFYDTAGVRSACEGGGSDVKIALMSREIDLAGFTTGPVAKNKLLRLLFEEYKGCGPRLQHNRSILQAERLWAMINGAESVHLKEENCFFGDECMINARAVVEKHEITITTNWGSECCANDDGYVLCG